ncbi:MAG: hypothetical protein RI988_1774 [Pseudomonadota bacterium]|jgi:hypothetical protein
MLLRRSTRRVALSVIASGLGTLRASRSLQAAPPPVSRDAFAKAVPRGFPKEKLLKLLGKPDREQKNKAEGLSSLFYNGLVLAPKSGRIESVTVLIFDEYETVHSVRWADGTVAE